MALNDLISAIKKLLAHSLTLTHSFIGRYQIILAWWQRHMCVRNLPRVASQKYVVARSLTCDLFIAVQSRNHCTTEWQLPSSKWIIINASHSASINNQSEAQAVVRWAAGHSNLSARLVSAHSGWQDVTHILDECDDLTTQQIFRCFLYGEIV